MKAYISEFQPRHLQFASTLRGESTSCSFSNCDQPRTEYTTIVVDHPCGAQIVEFIYVCNKHRKVMAGSQ